MIPISVRTEDQKGTHGNQVSMMLASLETERDDPADRLAHIHDNMLVAKEQQNAIGADTLQEWAEFAAPAIFSRAARLYSNTRIADMHRPIFNVCISNVPGPPFPLYLAGARLVSMLPLGPPIEGAGLNITVMSYIDRIDWGFIACRELAPRLHDMAHAVEDAHRELLKAAKIDGDGGAENAG
jgi:WS/DGAT/MGAT family acyltransferase